MIYEERYNMLSKCQARTFVMDSKKCNDVGRRCKGGSKFSTSIRFLLEILIRKIQTPTLLFMHTQSARKGRKITGRDDVSVQRVLSGH